MHYLGRQQWTEVISGTTIKTTLADYSYNFNDQKYHNLDTAITIMPGKCFLSFLLFLRFSIFLNFFVCILLFSIFLFFNFAYFVTTNGLGDMLNTTCVWSSVGKTTPTDFGESTTREMCLMFLA